MEWFWRRYGFILTLSIFIQILFYSKAGYNEPMQEWYPTFVDNIG